MKIFVVKEKPWKNRDIEVCVQAVEDALNFYRLHKVKVTLDFLKSFGESTEAYCVQESKKKFRIELNRKALKKADSRELQKVVYHEVTHIKQFVQDKLILKGEVAKFKGKVYPTKGAKSYWLSPWEMEARAMEDALIALT